MIKRSIVLFLTILALLLLTIPAWGQSSMTRVTLKNGMMLTGVMKSFNPVSHMEIEISGIATRIEAADIEKVEQLEAVANTNKEKEVSPQYPTDSIVTIGGVQVKFLLVKGGTFTYGYSGKGSLKMNSEPVHSVTLSPFYVSERPVTVELFKAVETEWPVRVPTQDPSIVVFNGGDEWSSGFMGWFKKYINCCMYATSFLDKLRSVSGNKRIDCLTETQWAYLRVHDVSGIVWGPFEYEFTRYVEMNASENPTPIGQRLLLKWIHNEAGVNARYDPNPANPFFGDVSIKFNGKTRNWVPVTPLHLTFPAK